MDNLDARKLPIYHTIVISQNESYTVDYVNTKNGVTKAWKKNNLELLEENYLIDVDNPLYILELSQKNDIKQTIKNPKKNNYQQFIKEKKEEYAKIYPNMTKKERYLLILEEWKKNKK